MGTRHVRRVLRRRWRTPSSTSSTPFSIRGCALSEPNSSTARRRLEVRDLSVSFATRHGVVRAVDGLSLDVGRQGGAWASSASRVRARASRCTRCSAWCATPTSSITGSVRFEGREILGLLGQGDAAAARRRDRHDLPGPDDGAHAGVHRGLADRRADSRPQRHHQDAGHGARDRAARPRSASPTRDEPRRLSTRTSSPGACASAWSSRWRCRAIRKLLIADEPTTALDVTTQAQILDLMGRLRRRRTVRPS